MLHAVHLLVVLFVSAPLASFILVAALAGALTTVQDLMIVITAGFVLSNLLFLHPITTAVGVERQIPLIEDDVPDRIDQFDDGYELTISTDPSVVVYRISGAFFFGAVANVSVALDHIGESPRAYVIDFSAVPMVDSTAASTVRSPITSAGKKGGRIYLSAISPFIR